MQIVGQGEGWLGKEPGQEEKGKKLAAAVAAAAAGLFILACLLNGRAAAFADPYLVKLGDIEVVAGKTTIGDLSDAGYGFSDASKRKMARNDKGSFFIYSELYDISAKASGNTVYTSITLVKDGQCVALISAVNEKSVEVPLAECKLRGISIAPDYYESENVTLEGVSLGQLSTETLTEVLGKPKSVSDTGDKYRWERGAGRITLKCKEDGTLESFSARYSKF